MKILFFQILDKHFENKVGKNFKKEFTRNECCHYNEVEKNHFKFYLFWLCYPKYSSGDDEISFRNIYFHQRIYV